MNSINSFLNTNKERLIGELFDLLKIPSVSADSYYTKDVFKAAEFVASSLKIAGCDKVEICQTKGYPIVYGEKLIDPTLPTILVCPQTLTLALGLHIGTCTGLDTGDTVPLVEFFFNAVNDM